MNTQCGDLSSLCVLTHTIIMVSPRAKGYVQPTTTMRKLRQRNYQIDIEMLKDKLVCVGGT